MLLRCLARQSVLACRANDPPTVESSTQEQAGSVSVLSAASSFPLRSRRRLPKTLCVLLAAGDIPLVPTTGATVSVVYEKYVLVDPLRLGNGAEVHRVNINTLRVLVSADIRCYPDADCNHPFAPVATGKMG